MLADTRVLSHDRYIRAAMTHRFCLVVPGDYQSTHKAAETMAVGGAGGCVPVFVVPTASRGRTPSLSQIEDGVASLLPYTSWLDYCEVAFVISEYVASRNMSLAVEQLAAVPERVLDAKRQALRTVRPAFVFRRTSPCWRILLVELLGAGGAGAG